MNLELIEVMRQIERSRKVDRTVIIEAIEAALISASRKNYGATQDIHIVFNEETGDLIANVRKTVVGEVKEPWREISLEDARRIKADAQVDELLEIPMAPSDFGRIAAQTAKQVVLQRVRESERNAIFEEYQKRLGEIINGIVLRMENRNVIVDLGETEAVLPVREQAPREYYQIGDRIKTFILDVRHSNRSPQVILSRTHPGLIRKLFEMEVPEVTDGVVSIKAVAREAGARSKVAVVSKDKNVDPVGACVGIKGSRIQTIVREIRGEKIDVIPFSENVETLLKSALQPAKVMFVKITPEQQHAMVVVKDDQLSLAIGKNGQNVRLASKLTGWKIDIVSEAQNQEEMRKKAEEAFLSTAPALEKMPGIGPKMAQKLKDAGYLTAANFVGVTAEKLQEVPGIGEKTAQKIMDVVTEYLPKPAKEQVVRTAAQLFAGLGDDDEAAKPRVKEIAAGDLFAGLDRTAAAEAANSNHAKQESESEPSPQPAQPEADPVASDGQEEGEEE